MRYYKPSCPKYMRILITVLVSLFTVGQINAQRVAKSSASIQTISNPGTGYFHYANRNEPPRAIEFEERTVTSAQFLQNINSYLNVPADFTFAESESTTDQLGMKHRLLQQHYKGIPLEGMLYRVHEKNGFVRSANGRAVRSINLDMSVKLNEDQAFEYAKRHVKSRDTTIRQGKRIIASRDFSFTPESFSIAFQYDIDVSFSERWRVSIDARTGNIVNKVSLVHNCSTHEKRPLPFGSGSGLTRYYGRQNIKVEMFDDGSSRMIGQTDNGGKIETYDINHFPARFLNFGFPIPLYDISSSFNTYDLPDQKVAVSVQWGTEKAYEYYFKKYGRNSFDNNGATIASYVHLDENLDNAFWTGKALAFGDGSNNNPLVELDVVSHELTHAVTQYEAGLQYYYEPGALNESFSDIFGKAVEFDTFGDTATWQLAKHFREGGLRDLANPNLQSQPDTYEGDLWISGDEDYGGVHYNSGVQNFWFYLLCEGGSGTNDHETAYSINAIGIEAASTIAYRNLTEYLSTTSDYMDSRVGSLLAAADLYGKNSIIYNEVSKAWNAVGVIDQPIITELEVYDITGTAVKLRGNLLPRGTEVTYRFEYGKTPALGSTTTTYEYIDKVEGVITGLESETRYYLRLVATNEHGDSYSYSGFKTLSPGPIVKLKPNIDVTETSATFYGAINPNNLEATYHFEYGTTTTFGSVTPSFSLSASTEFQDVSGIAINLQPRQTYYYRLSATNSAKSVSSTIGKFFTASRPVITSYAPLSSAINEELTITGLNFNPVSEKNFVTVGAVRAQILSSSDTEIRIKVPAGASLGKIRVTDLESALACESIHDFVPTYSGEFDASSLQISAGFTDLGSNDVTIGDIDGDNRPDIVYSHYAGFTVLQNTIQGDKITAGSFVRNGYSSDKPLYNLTLADFDGNGLKDIVALYNTGIRIYPNLSVPGFIFFGSPIDLATGYLAAATYNDFDLDGLVDIAITQTIPGDSTLLSIYRNQSPKGSLSSVTFVPRYTKALPGNVFELDNDDLNNDGKPDLTGSIFYKTEIITLKNGSVPGVFHFDDNIISDPTISTIADHLTQDLNGDNWKDVVAYSAPQADEMIVMQNTGGSSEISVNKPLVYASTARATFVQPGDLDGDGKVDVMVGLPEGNFLLLKNNTIAGAPIESGSFDDFANFGTASEAISGVSGISIGDLNGDGKPEMVTTYFLDHFPHAGYEIEIWENTTASCLDPSLVSVDAAQYFASVVLPVNTTVDQFQIEYRAEGIETWSSNNATTLYNLNPGTHYELRVRARCQLGFTQYHYSTFETKCIELNSLSIYYITPTYASITANNLELFEIQYSPAGEDEYVTLPQYSYHISDLIPGTTYDVRYRGRCSIATDFEYLQFATPCPSLEYLYVASLTYNSAQINWTSYYTGSVILEYSTDQVNWTLVDETQLISPLVPGHEYFVRGAFVCATMQSDFSFTSFTTPCPSVSELLVDDIDPFNAHLTWSDESATGNYIVSYTASGGPANIVTVNSTSLNLAGLNPGTDYYVAVAPQCSGANNFFSTSFRTPCFVPGNLSVTSVTHTTATVTWSDEFDGGTYMFDYSISGSHAWMALNASEKQVSLSELRPGTQYSVRIYVSCRTEPVHYANIEFETSLFEKTTFFPNPTDADITIEPSKDLIGSRYVIFDNVGRNVAEGEIQKYVFDMSLFHPGIYTLKIDGEQPMRIVKH